MSKQASEARQCLEQFFDAGTFVEVDRLMRDGENDVPVVCGYGLVNDAPVYAFAQDKTVCSGAVGKAHAAKIKSVYHLARHRCWPDVFPSPDRCQTASHRSFFVLPELFIF